MKRLAVALCALLAASAAPALARPLADPPCTTFTDNAGNERWSDGANWTTGAPPQAGAAACIPDSFPVVFVDAPAQAGSLAAAKTALFVTADLSLGAGGGTVAGLDVGDGTVASAGPLAAGTVNLHGGSLGALTAGSLRWAGGALDGAATVTGNAVLAGDLRGAGALAIAAGGTAHAGADTTLSVPLTDDGQLFVDGGVLMLTGGSPAGSGSYQVAGGATLDWHSGAYTLSSPTISGSGSALVSGATLTVTGPARAGAPLAIFGVARFAGALTAGSVTVNGTLELPGGAQLDTLANSGTVRLGGAPVTATTYTQAAGATLAEALGGGALTVHGAAALDGTLTFDRGAGAIADGASFPLIGYGSLTGGWATVAVAPLAGMAFGVAYGGGGATLNAHRILPAPTPTPTPTPVPPPPPPPPKAGVRGVAAPDSGTVLLQAPPASPGAPAKFVPLQAATSVAVGDVIDARKGRVTLTTASSFTNAKRATTKVSVAGAIFQIRQTRATDGRTAVTDLVMKTPPGLAHACVPPHKGIVRTLLRARVSHRTIRRLNVTAKGVVRAFGRVAVLTARNATFDLRDRCDGTAAHVSKGRASLFDRLRGRSARLRARHTRVIRARLFTARRLHLKRVPKPRVP